MRSSNTCVHVLHLLSDSTYVNDLKYVSPFIKEGILIHDRVKKKWKKIVYLPKNFIYTYMFYHAKEINDFEFLAE